MTGSACDFDCMGGNGECLYADSASFCSSILANNSLAVPTGSVACGCSCHEGFVSQSKFFGEEPENMPVNCHIHQGASLAFSFAITVLGIVCTAFAGKIIGELHVRLEDMAFIAFNPTIARHSHLPEGRQVDLGQIPYWALDSFLLAPSLLFLLTTRDHHRCPENSGRQRADLVRPERRAHHFARHHWGTGHGIYYSHHSSLVRESVRSEATKRCVYPGD